MTLRVPCEHQKWDAHGFDSEFCHGGREPTVEEVKQWLHQKREEERFPLASRVWGFAVTRSDQLRQALDWYDGLSQEATRYEAAEVAVILDAARLALKVWEGDEQLVERVAVALREYMRSLSPNLATEWEFNIERARVVLAAITEEEQK